MSEAATMTAAVLTGHGGLDAIQVRHDVPAPRPGAGEVVVRVAAAAVNNTDVWTRQGAYGLPGRPQALAGWRGRVDFPRVQGGDIAGTVAGIGAGVDAALLGRRVLVDPALYEHDGPAANLVGVLGSEADGGFAEYVAVAASRAHDMTGSPLSDEQLACLPISYGTAMGMLERGGVTAGETVLVTGASGGVGYALVQLAAGRGAHVVAVTTRAKSDLVREAGAAALIHRDTDDLAAAVARAAPAGMDAVADVVGGQTMTGLLPQVRDGGRWIVAGALGGPVVELDLRRLYLRTITLIGSSMHTPAHFSRLAQAARRGQVVPRIAARYALADIHAAQREFLQRNHTGKIVLVP